MQLLFPLFSLLSPSESDESQKRQVRKVFACLIKYLEAIYLKETGKQEPLRKKFSLVRGNCRTTPNVSEVFNLAAFYVYQLIQGTKELSVSRSQLNQFNQACGIIINSFTKTGKIIVF